MGFFSGLQVHPGSSYRKDNLQTLIKASEEGGNAVPQHQRGQITYDSAFLSIDGKGIF